MLDTYYETEIIDTTKTKLHPVIATAQVLISASSMVPAVSIEIYSSITAK